MKQDGIIVSTAAKSPEETSNETLAQQSLIFFFFVMHGYVTRKRKSIIMKQAIIFCKTFQPSTRMKHFRRTVHREG